MSTRVLRWIFFFLLVLTAIEIGARLRAQAPDLPTPAPALDQVTKLRKELADAAEQLVIARAQLAVCQGQLAPQTAQQQLAEVAAERGRIVADFEQAHPGFTIDLATGKVTAKKGGG